MIGKEVLSQEKDPDDGCLRLTDGSKTRPLNRRTDYIGRGVNWILQWAGSWRYPFGTVAPTLDVAAHWSNGSIYHASNGLSRRLPSVIAARRRSGPS